MDLAKENLHEADVRLLLEFAFHHQGDFQLFVSRQQLDMDSLRRVVAARELTKRLAEKALD